MARKVGQIIARGTQRWLIRVYLGRDHETKKRKYHNRTIHGSMREAQAYLTKIARTRPRPRFDWIAHSGKNLTAIYATHGHRDYFFGVNIIQKKFPKARFVATSEVIAVMRKQASVPVVESYWKHAFPDKSIRRS